MDDITVRTRHENENLTAKVIPVRFKSYENEVTCGILKLHTNSQYLQEAIQTQAF